MAFGYPGMSGSMGSLPAVAGMGTMAAKINWLRVWRAVKILGIGAVAAAMQVDVGELAAQLLQHPPRRRRKGITGRQLAQARRVNRIVCNWHKQLTGTSYRRKSCK